MQRFTVTCTVIPLGLNLNLKGDMGVVKGLQSIFTVKIKVVLHFLTIHSRFILQRIALFD